jgi:hypothetical protein
VGQIQSPQFIAGIGFVNPHFIGNRVALFELLS